MSDPQKTPVTRPSASVGPGRDGTADGVQVYRSTAGMVAWWLWAAFALANLIDLAVQGHDHLSAEAAAVLLVITGIAYTCALRPRVISAADGITIRNPLRDHHVRWAAVTRVDLGDLLRVHCAGEAGGRDRLLHAWAVQASRRSQSAAAMRASTGSALTRRSVGGTSARAPSPGGLHQAAVKRIAEALNDRAQREKEDNAAQAAGPPSVSSHWHWPAVLSVVLPLVLLIAVVLN